MSRNNGTLNPAKLLEMGQKRESRAAAKGDTAAANAALGNIAGLFGKPTVATNAVANAVVNAAATAVANANGPTTLNVSVGNKKYKAVITAVGGRRNKTNGGKRKRAHHKRTRRNKRKGTRRNKRN
jgi:hypothetical protein